MASPDNGGHWATDADVNDCAVKAPTRVSLRSVHGKPGLALEVPDPNHQARQPMNQPASKPKTFYEKTIPELQAELVEMVSHGNYSFSPANYAEQIGYLHRKKSDESANTLAKRSIRTATIAAAAATISAIATAVNSFGHGHHEVPPPTPPPPLVITQIAPPPAPVTITQTVLPPPPPAPSHP